MAALSSCLVCGGRLTARMIGSGAAVGWASFQAPAYRAYHSPAAGPVPVLTSMRRLFKRSTKCPRAVGASVQLQLLMRLSFIWHALTYVGSSRSLHGGVLDSQILRRSYESTPRFLRNLDEASALFFIRVLVHEEKWGEYPPQLKADASSIVSYWTDRS